MKIPSPSTLGPQPSFGHFDDAAAEYVITDPDTPSPWINYLGNTRMSCFVSQQAGGLAWHVEPQTRRLSRYYWLPAPGDRPGFYVYIRDENDGVIWNPHFGPTRTPLDRYACRHGLGYSHFAAERGGVRASVRYFIPPDDDVMAWDVKLENVGAAKKRLTVSSYLEFGLLEAARELFWCYLKNHIAFTFDAKLNGIRYDYHAFEAPFTPKILFACTRPVDGYDADRAAFLGRGGTLERPAMPLSHSELPGGGQGVGALGLRLRLAPGGSERFSFLLAVADVWEDFERLSAFDADAALEKLRAHWARKTGACRVEGGDSHFARVVNTWAPLNCQVTLERARDLSTDHTGVDGMRFRDTMQDALAVAHFDPAFAAERIRLVLASQAADGSGNFAFYPFAREPRYVLAPVRCDNGVWPAFTIDGLLNETGDFTFLDATVPFRDGGEASVYEHVRRGLAYIDARRGPHGLPVLFDADWNDGLALFGDRAAESVMLGMQMAAAWRIFAGWAERFGRDEDAENSRAKARRYRDACNAPGVWDGAWYSRLLLSDGMRLGSREQPQGRIYLEPQAWAVLSGVGEHEDRGRCAMASALELLDTAHGLRICDPPYTGIPTPDDPPLGSAPGTGENGAIFCHANAWAVMALCRLGLADEAWACFRNILPSVVAERVGQAHWGREPYVFNSTITGPARGKDFGRGGIGWLTGTASWMYVAATREILGVRPRPDGLRVKPCLPAAMMDCAATRLFRGRSFTLEYRRARPSESPCLFLNGERIDGDTLPLSRCQRHNRVDVLLTP